MRTRLRQFSELNDTGLLWAINATLLHPRGFVMALHYRDDPLMTKQPIGWSLLGDGSEPLVFDSVKEEFLKFQRLLEGEQ